MFIRSESLFLRPFWPEDRAELLALVTAALGTASQPCVTWPMAVEGAAAPELEDRRCPRFLITLPGAQNAQIVGVVGLERIGDDVEAHVWIAPEFRRRGFGAEAGWALLSVARGLQLPRVIARRHDRDEAARGLLAKLCFTRSGDVLEHVFDDPCGGGDAPIERLAA